MTNLAPLKTAFPVLKNDGTAIQASSSAPKALSRRQKAAVVIRLLVNGGADPGLRDLPPEQQRRLVHDMASLRFVDRATLAAVIAEFATELDGIGLHFPRDPARHLAALDGILSLDVVESLSAEFGGNGDAGDAPWNNIAEAEDTELLALVENESDEVCAIMLSKLPPARAAALIRDLPGVRGEAIVAAFARTEAVTPAAVSRIGLALARQTATRPTPAFETDGVRRVAGILNNATSGLRRSILESLDAADGIFAERVRAAVFSYENIPDRVAARDVPRVLREVDNDTLVVALAGTPPELAAVREFLLAALSKRMAEQLTDQMAELAEPPTPDAADAAMAEVVSAIRAMEERGDLSLTVANA